MSEFEHSYTSDDDFGDFLKGWIRNPLAIGACALLYMATIYDITTPYHIVVVGQMLLALGLGLAVSPATNSIMSSVPINKAGIGSAMNDTTRQLGGALAPFGKGHDYRVDTGDESRKQGDVTSDMQDRHTRRAIAGERDSDVQRSV